MGQHMRFWYYPIYTQTPPLNAHADVSSRARGLNFGQRLYLHPYFVYTSSKGSGRSALCVASFLDNRISKKCTIISCAGSMEY